MGVKAKQLIKEINEKYGEGVLRYGGERHFEKLPRLPTGSFSLNMETGGGWPRGRVHHIYGPPSAGKSYLLYKHVAIAQIHCFWCSEKLTQCTCGAKDPIACAWIDVESTDEENWRLRIGIDSDLFIVSRPEHAQQAIDVIDMLIRSGEIGVIVLDSVASMVPMDNIEKSAEDGMQPGSVARLMSLATRKWQSALNTRLKHPVTGELWPNLCTVFLLNQLRDTISRIPGPPQPPGGWALKHAASIQLKLFFAPGQDVAMQETDDGQKHATSQTIRFFTEKNKTYDPRRTGEMVLDFANCTIDNDRQMFNYAVRDGVVQQSGAHYTFDGVKVHGKEKALHAFNESGAINKIGKEVWKIQTALLESRVVKKEKKSAVAKGTEESKTVQPKRKNKPRTLAEARKARSKGVKR